MKIVLLLIGFILATIHFAEAQQLKLPRIGFVGTASASALASRLNAFRQGLRELDYIEGKNIAIEYRVVEGNPERLDEVAAELASQKVDVIVTHGEAAIRAFKRATTSIPIVVGVTGDLVVSGHAASLARPGGNITGLVDTSPELSGKRLEILKDLTPSLTYSCPVEPGQSGQGTRFQRDRAGRPWLCAETSIRRGESSGRF